VPAFWFHHVEVVEEVEEVEVVEEGGENSVKDDARDVSTDAQEEDGVSRGGGGDSGGLSVSINVFSQVK
jgi:hypothetical protein